MKAAKKAAKSVNQRETAAWRSKENHRKRNMRGEASKKSGQASCGAHRRRWWARYKTRVKIVAPRAGAAHVGGGGGLFLCARACVKEMRGEGRRKKKKRNRRIEENEGA